MGNSKPSIRQEQKSVSQRLGALEQNFTRFLIGVQQRLSNLDQKVGPSAEQLAALIELSGKEEVEKIIQEKRIERAHAEAAVEKSRLEEGVKDGYVVAATSVEKRSLIVGRYIKPDGSVIEPGRSQLVMPGVAQPFQDKLVGMTVGTSIDLPGNMKFELLEIYNVDEDKAKTLFAERQQAAQNALKSASDAAQGAAASDEAQDASSEDQNEAEVSAPPVEPQE